MRDIHLHIQDSLVLQVSLNGQQDLCPDTVVVCKPGCFLAVGQHIIGECQNEDDQQPRHQIADRDPVALIFTGQTTVLSHGCSYHVR